MSGDDADQGPEAGALGAARPVGAWRVFLTAVQFLTRLPVPGAMSGDLGDYAEALRRSPVYFPVVGAGIGLFTGLVAAGAGLAWPAAVAAVLALIAEALLTGAFHEDAVADFCDAFGGGWTREDVLRILKDSRVGSFGALGLGLAVAARGTTLAALADDPARLVAAVVASATLGRWAILLAMRSVPPVADRESLARDVGRQLDPRALAVGTAWAVPGVLPMAWLDPLRLALAVAAILALHTWFARLVRRRIGGVTGDCLGFLCYAAQVAALLAAAGRWPGSRP